MNTSLMQSPLFTYSPTGVLYRTIEEAIEAKRYEMYLQVDSCGLLSQSKPINTEVLKPQNGWSRSNEPEEHLDQVAKELSMYLKEGKSNVLLFSYKDTSLLNRIKAKKQVSADYVYKHSEFGGGSTWPEDEDSEEVKSRIASHQGKYKLIICRHYLEHYENPLIIMEAMIEKMSEDGQIYIEVPDCSKFIKRKNPLFMWEQHKQYFTKKSLVKMMNQINLDCKAELYGESIEPSICCIMKKDKSFDQKIEHKEKRERIIEIDVIDEYVESWKGYFETSKRRKFLLGIGHNSDRFIQLTRSQNQFQSLIDYDRNKAGMYVGNCALAIVSEIEASNSENIDIILGVHDRSFGRLRDKLSERYANARIWSIFSMHES